MKQAPPAQPYVIRAPALQKITGLHRGTIWRLENAGKFPRRIKLSSMAVGWRSDEVQAWMDARVRGELYAQPKLGVRQ